MNPVKLLAGAGLLLWLWPKNRQTKTQTAMGNGRPAPMVDSGAVSISRTFAEIVGCPAWVDPLMPAHGRPSADGFDWALLCNIIGDYLDTSLTGVDGQYSPGVKTDEGGDAGSEITSLVLFAWGKGGELGPWYASALRQAGQVMPTSEHFTVATGMAGAADNPNHWAHIPWKAVSK